MEEKIFKAAFTHPNEHQKICGEDDRVFLLSFKGKLKITPQIKKIFCDTLQKSGK